MIGMQAASFPEVELAWVSERVARFAAPAPPRRRWFRRSAAEASPRPTGSTPTLGATTLCAEQI